MSSLALGLGARLRAIAHDPSRQRELGLAAVVVGLAGWLSLSIGHTYPLLFGGLVSLAVLVLMVENQERTLHVLLWFSTIYLMLRATLLGWSNLAFLFKDGFLALLFAFWLFHLVLRQERIVSTPLNRPIALLVAWLIVQCFNPNTYGFMTISQDLRFWLGPIAIFFLTVHLVNTRARVDRAIRVVFTYALLEALYGIAQQAMPGDLLVTLGADPQSYFYFFQGSIRSFSTMGTAPFALFASMFPPIAFFYMSQARTPLARAALFAAGFAFVAAVVFTLVRTGWVACIGSVAAYAVVTRRWKILLVLVLCGLVVFMTASGYMRWKVEGIVNPEDDASVQRRLEIIELVSTGIAFRAFGYGLGTFAHNRFGIGMDDKIGYGTATENWYLMTALQLGWIGIGLMAWIWFKLYRLAWTGYRGGLRTARYRELAIALAGGMFAIEVARMGGPAGYYPPDSWHYWFFAALLVMLPKADAELAAEQAGEPAAGPPGPPVRTAGGGVPAPRGA